MSECVVDGEDHSAGVGYFNPDDGPGKMCRKHYNQWRASEGMEVRWNDDSYHSPDAIERGGGTLSQKSQEDRNRVVNGDVWRDAE